MRRVVWEKKNTGQADMEASRAIVYPEANVVMICFSLANLVSYRNVDLVRVSRPFVAQFPQTPPSEHALVGAALPLADPVRLCVCVFVCGRCGIRSGGRR